VIKNGDNVSHSVSGWTVRDKAGRVYKFGSLSLGAGKQAIIHTGDGSRHTTSTSTHLYWGREWYVWNNTGDKVILRRADGSLKDTCTYTAPAARSTARAYGTDGWHRLAASGAPGRRGPR
jgi:Lamin Tail Domain